MKKIKTYQILNLVIASVWLVNGLFCKVLNLVPRHEEIVSRILGNDHSGIITVTIGCLEIIMAIWILSGFKSKLHANLQIIIVVLMNIMEFILVPDLLLWGKFNIIFALAFVSLVHYTYFIHNQNYVPTT